MPEEADQKTVADMAKRHGLSEAAVLAVLQALRSSGGGLAQFNHPELGGMGQWSGGMTMIGEMFNDRLKAKVGALAADLSEHVRSSPAAKEPEVSYRSAASSRSWWPGGFGQPASTGSQNGMRYAVFPSLRRLVIDDAGDIAVYDTGDHVIAGAGQQQGGDSTFAFTSQNGLVRVSALRRVGTQR